MDFDPQIFRKLFLTGAGSFEEDLAAPRYISELSSYGTAKLHSEPDRLAEEKALLHEQTETLAFAHYKTFIEAANCSRDLRADFSGINSDVSQLLSDVPDLAQSCRSFMTKAQEVGHARRVNDLALQRHSQLLELLEIPQVMDTCIRGSYYEEALELAQYVTKLQRRLSHVPIVEQIAKEVMELRSALCNNLVAQLHGTLTLPAALKTLAYLRRLSVFSETELRILFLQARDGWFQKEVAKLPSEDAYQHMMKLIETSRTNLFDIITQYRAVFADEDPMTLAMRDPAVPNPMGVFQSWLIRQVNWFLDQLRLGLASETVSDRLDSLLAQTMYFGLSFGRIGADFRGLAAPLFHDAAQRQFEKHLGVGNDSLLDAIRSCSTIGELMNSRPNSNRHTEGVDNDPLIPPSSLLDCPILAFYVNSILNGFNSLRLCALLPIALRVTAVIERSLLTIADALVDRVDGKFEPNSSTMRDLIVDVVVPYVNGCLEELFPRATLMQALGVSSSNDAENFSCKLDRKTIAAKLGVKPLVSEASSQPRLLDPENFPSVASTLPNQPIKLDQITDLDFRIGESPSPQSIANSDDLREPAKLEPSNLEPSKQEPVRGTCDGLENREDPRTGASDRAQQPEAFFDQIEASQVEIIGEFENGEGEGGANGDQLTLSELSQRLVLTTEPKMAKQD